MNSPMIITSGQNPKIQTVRALLGQAKARRSHDAFIVEGIRLAEEALGSGWQPQLVLHSPDLSPRGSALLHSINQTNCEVIEVSPSIMQSLADTETSQGLLAVFPIRKLPIPEKLDFVVIADALRDPGNLGTLLRTCQAAGVQVVILTPGTVDAFSPKVVRAGMGAHFRLPVLDLPWSEINSLLRQCPAPVEIYLADLDAGTPVWHADFNSPAALLIGGEAEGPSEQARQIATRSIHIPMPGRSESLNAAVAAAILIYEVVRQRQK